MRFFVPIFLVPALLLAFTGCTKKTIQSPIQQNAFASQDVCAQGPFSVSLTAPITENPTVLRLGFAQDKTPAKLFYQIKIRESGKVLSNGALEQKLPEKDGKTNPCLARVMPGPAFTAPIEATGPSKPLDPNSYVLVIIPDVREPQMMQLGYQELPKNNPSVDIPLKDIPPGSSFEVLFWSEEPYPLGVARIQASIIEFREEWAPSPERIKARNERKEKRELREAEYALVQETKRFEAIKERDNELVKLAKDDPDQKKYFEAQRGKYLLRYNKQWQKALYSDKYSEGGKTLISLKLSQQVFAFLQPRQAQIDAYYRWQDERREDRRDERKDRRKEAVERYTKIEGLHLNRVIKRDTRKLKRQAEMKKDSQEYKDLNIKRGKKIKHYQKHLDRFEKLTDMRTFRHSKPESYYKFTEKARKWFNASNEQLSAYYQWKNNKDRERDEAKRNKEIKREKEKLAKQAKRAEELLSTWLERFETLKKDDEAAAQKAKDVKGDAKKKLNYKRGKNINRFRESFSDDYNKHSYRSQKARQQWDKLYYDVEAFVSGHAEQIDAFRTWKDEKRQLRKDAREKEKLAQESKHIKKTLATWKERFEALKKDDEAQAKESKDLKGDQKMKADYKRAKTSERFYKKFLRDYDKMYFSDSQPWETLRLDIYAFREARSQYIYAYEDWKSL
jgi:hypothetical protein